ncbi:MAG: hypothetical protein ACT4NY_33055 [Pseudonocardiales bacterium]
MRYELRGEQPSLGSRRELAEQRRTECDPGHHLSDDAGLTAAPCDPAADAADRDDQHNRDQESDDEESAAMS